MRAPDRPAGAPAPVGLRVPHLPRLGQPVAALAAGLALEASGTGGPLALVLGVAAGMPHGALDYIPAREMLAPEWGAAWPALFGAGYLGLSALVMAGWHYAPRATLVAFLAASTLHFGEEDVPNGGATQRLSQGSVPILLPVVFHTGETAELFSWVAGVDVVSATRRALIPALILWSATTATAAVREGTASGALAGSLPLVALFFKASPLTAFTSYFALVHTPRALSGLGAPGAVARQAAPLTGLALLLGALLWLRRPDLAFPERTVRTTFRLLAALTAPHMALRWWQRRRQTTANGSPEDGTR